MDEFEETLLQEEEMPPPSEDPDASHKPRRIALKYLFADCCCTTELEFGFCLAATSLDIRTAFRILSKICVSWGMSFPCPWYHKVPLSLALSPRIISEVANFKPDIIRASSPGIVVFGALAIAKMLCVPM